MFQRVYLCNLRQHNSTTEARLWEPLTEAVRRNVSKDQWPKNATVAEVMSSWTKAVGFPVVNVTRSRSSGNIVFTQVNESRACHRTMQLRVCAVS